MFDKYGRGVITWTELSAVMKLLGFPNISTGLLALAKIESNPNNSVGLDSKDIHKLLHSDELNSSLDYTFNRHNGLYNIRCIKKVVSIIVSGVLSLEDLHEARMSFILYEGELSNGIAMEEKTILSALRVTGKVVAPKKLQEWMKQLTPDVPGRIQLYEYFDLLKICDDKDGWMKLVNSGSFSNIEKKKNGLYELTDSSFLLTPDQKLLRKMDEEYDNMVTTLQVQQQVAREKSIKENNKSNNRDRGTKGAKINTLLTNYDQIKDAISNTNDRVVKSRASKSLNEEDSTKLVASFSETSLFGNSRDLRSQSRALSLPATSRNTMPSVRFRKN